MNFLAHLFLSGSDKDMILGNLIADSVKGKTFEHFNTGIQQGIRLHRNIDKFTDNHPVVTQSKERLRARYHKYAGVVTDMFYDHFLAANWEKYATSDLYEVTVKAYEILIINFAILPARIRRVLPFMLASNWLYSYRDLDMLKRYFTGMSKRTVFYSGMENAVEDLKKDYQLYKAEFEVFFPELITYVEEISGTHFRRLPHKS